MATRNDAWAQFAAEYQKYGKTPGPDEQHDFENIWNQSTEGGQYQGSNYNKSWADLWGGYAPYIAQRFASTNDRVVDSQSAEGNALYGSGSGNAKNIPGAPSQANASPVQQWLSAPTTLATPAPTVTQGSADALIQLLMQRAQQRTAPSVSDPTLRAQIDPQVAQATRASRNYVDTLAEQAGPWANLAGEQRLASERLGQTAAGIEGQVLGRETDARRQEIQNALAMWGSLLTNDQRLALERELAYLTTQTQRTSLAQQQDQFLRELALREAGQNNLWNYNWATLGA